MCLKSTYSCPGSLRIEQQFLFLVSLNSQARQASEYIAAKTVLEIKGFKKCVKKTMEGDKWVQRDSPTYEDLTIDPLLSNVERIERYATGTVELQRLVHVLLLW